MNGGVKQRHDVKTLDWIEGGGSYPYCQTVSSSQLEDCVDSRTIAEADKTVVCRSGRVFRCRSIQPQDRQIIQKLHEEWFPVLYHEEFFDELVLGRMIGSGDPLFTRLAIDDENDQSIAGCVVGSFVNGNLLAKHIQELLVNDLQRHPRLFYIMTLGSTLRRIGLATAMVEECLEEVQRDPLCGVVYLHVITDNTVAIRMYEQMGFYRVQEIENYYTIGDTMHNCFLYAKYFHGNRGHLTVWKQILRVLSFLWGMLQVWVSNLRRLPALEDERRNR